MGIFRPILFLIALALLLVSVRQFMNGYSDWQRAQLAEEGYRAEIRELEAERDRLKQRVEMLQDDRLTKERTRQKTTRLYQAG